MTEIMGSLCTYEDSEAQREGTNTKSPIVSQSGNYFLNPQEPSNGHLPLELLWGLPMWAAYRLGLPFAPMGHLSGFLFFSSKMGLGDMQAAIFTPKPCRLWSYWFL